MEWQYSSKKKKICVLISSMSKIVDLIKHEWSYSSDDEPNSSHDGLSIANRWKHRISTEIWSTTYYTHQRFIVIRIIFIQIKIPVHGHHVPVHGRHIFTKKTINYCNAMATATRSHWLDRHTTTLKTYVRNVSKQFVIFRSVNRLYPKNSMLFSMKCKWYAMLWVRAVLNIDNFVEIIIDPIVFSSVDNGELWSRILI